ncbi:MAG: hypothetical protein AAF658_01845 [Myxococcota bacterium]
MSAVTLKNRAVEAALHPQANQRLDHAFAAERVSTADSRIMGLPPGTVIDVEYRPSAEEAKDRELFVAVLTQLYGTENTPRQRARLLDSPDVAELWAQWQRGATVTFPRRLTLAPPAKRPRADAARPNGTLAAAFEVRSHVGVRV